MLTRQRAILLLAIGSQAALSVITFGLPAVGGDIESRYGVGTVGFGAVFAAVGVGSGLALVPAGCWSTATAPGAFCLPAAPSPPPA